MAMVHILDEITINKIAAGEVVERPASVIKELVENSIDAGANSIEVEISDGGSTYMRVTDDGIGMTEEDARLAVLRHATSKIQGVEDLFDIASLGFRGEALASIASVSNFVLTTRKQDSEWGTRVIIDGGTCIDCLPYGTTPGTTIEVKNLFYNTPVRRKFLKTERTESIKISDIVGKLALSNPQISFKLIINDRVSIITPGNGNLLETVTALYGYKVREDVFPISYEADSIVIDGVVSKPSLIKSTRTWQTIIVNNRVIGDKTIYKAIDNAYHALLPKNGFPLVVLAITVPADCIDINVHPRKSEVKFADDKVIYRAVYHAILQAIENPLGTMDTRSEVIDNQCSQEEAIATNVEFDKVFGHTRNGGYTILRDDTNRFVQDLRTNGFIAHPRASYEQDSFMSDATFSNVPSEFTSYTEEDKEKFRQLHRESAFQYPSSAGDTLQTVEETTSTMACSTGPKECIEQNCEGTDSITPPDKEALNGDTPIHNAHTRVIQNSGLLPMGQVASCYILAKKGDDLYIIDQHAAHERVRYDTLCKSAQAIPMQQLLVPIYVKASDDDMLIVEEYQEELIDVGFAVELGGPTQIKITGMPVDIVEAQGEDILQHVFSCLHEKQIPTKPQLRHKMLAYASCRGAIKAGHNLNLYQMSVLIEDLFHTDKPFVCPHGRPTIIKFTPSELGRLFLRS